MRHVIGERRKAKRTTFSVGAFGGKKEPIAQHEQIGATSNLCGRGGSGSGENYKRRAAVARRLLGGKMQSVFPD